MLSLFYSISRSASHFEPLALSLSYFWQVDLLVLVKGNLEEHGARHGMALHLHRIGR